MHKYQHIAFLIIFKVSLGPAITANGDLTSQYNFNATMKRNNNNNEANSSNRIT